MKSLWQGYNPRARATLLFAGLGLLYTLAQALVVPSIWDNISENKTILPISQLLGVVLRLAFTLLSFGVIYWMVRPGRRSPLEFGVLVLWVTLYCGLMSYAYSPSLILMVVPMVLRYWWSMQRTLVVSALLSLVALLSISGDYIKNSIDLQAFFQLAVLTLAQGGVSYAAFELMLRRDQDRAQLREALTELRQYHGLELQHAALEERARISRELHDTLGHELTALRLEIQKAKRLTDKPEDLRESLSRAMTRSGESMSSLQASVRALRPPLLDGTLQQAVSDLVKAWPAPVHYQWHGGEPLLSAPARLAVFRSVQEGLTNAQKHSAGHDIEVEVQGSPAALNLSIRNPLDPTAQDLPLNESGLGGLRLRLQEVGGQLKISREGRTFELRIYLPGEA